MHRLLAPLLAALLLACGGPRVTSHRADRADEEDEDDAFDEEPEEDDEEEESGFIDSALMGEGAAPLSLGEAVEVTGTGVTLRPPAGSQPMPFGAGFLALRQRVQISVVVAEGGPEVLEAIRTGGDPNAPAPTHEEEVSIDGQDGRLGRDRLRTQSASLERLWLLVHDGRRGMGVVATYEAQRARAYRPAMEEALRGVRWDHTAELDPSAALGIDVGPIPGLEASQRSTANLVFIAPGAEFPPIPGQVVLTVSPLPVRIPEDRISSLCGQLAARFVPVPTDAIEHEGAIEDGSMPGCERLGTAELEEGPRIATYAALLFHEGTPVLVTASVAADELGTWRDRFTAAARTVRIR